MAWRWSGCGTAGVAWKPRFLWQWPSAHLHFWSRFSFSSWQYPIDSLWGSGPYMGFNMTIDSLWGSGPYMGFNMTIYSLWGSGLVSLLASQAHQHHGHLTNFWCFWQVPNPAGKWNQHLYKAGQQKEAWSAPKCIDKRLQWRWFSKNTMDQHQQMTLHPKSSQTVET